MTQIYSACVSVSQGLDAPVVRAYMSFAEDEHKTDIDVQWSLPSRINADGNVGEWLYAVLNRLVQDYDDHQVNRTRFETKGQGGHSANA